MARRAYPTDLSAAEWVILKPLVPPVKAGGHPALHSRREIINGIRYVLRSGGAWRLLPPGARWAFLPRQTV
jgi:transposase